MDNPTMERHVEQLEEKIAKLTESQARIEERQHQYIKAMDQIWGDLKLLKDVVDEMDEKMTKLGVKMAFGSRIWWLIVTGIGAVILTFVGLYVPGK